MKYIIANWKANKNFLEAAEWCGVLLHNIESNSLLKTKLGTDELRIVVCPPLPFLSLVKEKLQSHFVHVGSQDISQYEKGSYTGEVTGPSLTGLAQYAIVGHSERRNNLRETNDLIQRKVDIALQYHIQPILCVRGLDDPVIANAQIIAYEPVQAIGTGKNEDIATVVSQKKQMKMGENQLFIYGGSVNEENCKEYMSHSEIHGVLVGTACLNPQQFYSTIEAAIS